MSENDSNNNRNNYLKKYTKKFAKDYIEFKKDQAESKFTKASSKLTPKNFEKIAKKINSKNFKNINNTSFKNYKEISQSGLWKNYTNTASKTVKGLLGIDDLVSLKQKAIDKEYGIGVVLDSKFYSGNISKYSKRIPVVGKLAEYSLIPILDKADKSVYKFYDRNFKKYGRGVLLGTDGGFRLYNTGMVKMLNKNGRTAAVIGLNGEMREVSAAGHIMPSPMVQQANNFGTKVASWIKSLFGAKVKKFHSGGTVPGRDEVMAILQGGETVRTEAQERALQEELARRRAYPEDNPRGGNSKDSLLPRLSKEDDQYVINLIADAYRRNRYGFRSLLRG